MTWFRCGLLALPLLLLGVVGAASLIPAERDELLPNYELKPEPERLKITSEAANSVNTEGAHPNHETFEGIAYGPHPTHNILDMYVPRNKTPVPLIVYIHAEDEAVGESPSNLTSSFLQAGFAVAQIEYRPATASPGGNVETYEFPAQIEDCKAAIRFLRANAAKYKIDSERIGVVGRSLGGYLSSLLCTTSDTELFEVGEYLDQSSAVQAASSWNGPTNLRSLGHEQDYHAECLAVKSPQDRHDVFGMQYARGRLRIAERASPITYVTSAAPPLLLIAGFNNIVVPPHQANSFYSRLRNIGCDAEMEIVVGGDHSGPTIDNPETRAKTVDFFDRKLRRKNE